MTKSTAEKKPKTYAACSAWVKRHGNVKCFKSLGLEELWDTFLQEMYGLTLALVTSGKPTPAMLIALEKAKAGIKRYLAICRGVIIVEQCAHGPVNDGAPPRQERKLGEPSSASAAAVQERSKRRNDGRTTESRRPDCQLEWTKFRLNEVKMALKRLLATAYRRKLAAECKAAFKAKALELGIDLGSMDEVSPMSHMHA